MSQDDDLSSKQRRKIKSATKSSRDRLSFDPNKVISEDIPQTRKKRRRTVHDDDEVNNLELRQPSYSNKPKRLPRSVSEEVLALEGRFHPQSTSREQDEGRKRKKNIQKRAETDPNNPSADRPPTGRRQTRTKDNRKKRKPRSTVFTSGEEDNYEGDGEISEIFQVDKEDIIQTTETDLSQSASKMHAVNSFIVAPPSLLSQTNDILYIEKKDGQGFVKEHRNRVNKQPDRTDYSLQLIDDSKEYTTLDFMLKVHLAFRSLAMIGHGLLAGLAISQCVFVYTLSDTSSITLLENYRELALPYQAVYYFLLAVSTVSVLDRYVNTSAGWSQFILRLLTRPSRALAIVSYLFALTFSVSLAQLDDRVSLYKDVPSLWLAKDFDKLSTWKVINLLRVIGSVLGWILVAFAPIDDHTAIMIKAGIEQETTERSKKHELNEIKSPSLQQTWDRVT